MLYESLLIISRLMDIALTQFGLLCTDAANLPALADICLLLVEAKAEKNATLPETAMPATVECVAVAATARGGRFTAKVMYGDLKRQDTNVAWNEHST